MGIGTSDSCPRAIMSRAERCRASAAAVQSPFVAAMAFALSTSTWQREYSHLKRGVNRQWVNARK